MESWVPETPRLKVGVRLGQNAILLLEADPGLPRGAYSCPAQRFHSLWPKVALESLKYSWLKLKRALSIKHTGFRILSTKRNVKYLMNTVYVDYILK